MLNFILGHRISPPSKDIESQTDSYIVLINKEKRIMLNKNKRNIVIRRLPASANCLANGTNINIKTTTTTTKHQVNNFLTTMK